MDKKIVGLILGVASISILFGVIVSPMFYSHIKNLYGNVGVDLETSSIHCKITMWKDNELVFDQYHSGVVTDIGDNATLMWIFGDSDYNVDDYLDNATYISIGNEGSLSTSSTQLPGEWNRTQGTVEDESQSWLNITCTFYPDNAGPYTADCIGLNWENAGDNNLWAYDTFTEVSGIDETFTINVEFKVSVAHS